MKRSGQTCRRARRQCCERRAHSGREGDWLIVSNATERSEKLRIEKRLAVLPIKKSWQFWRKQLQLYKFESQKCVDTHIF